MLSVTLAKFNNYLKSDIWSRYHAFSDFLVSIISILFFKSLNVNWKKKKTRITNSTHVARNKIDTTFIHPSPRNTGKWHSLSSPLHQTLGRTNIAVRWLTPVADVAALDNDAAARVQDDDAEKVTIHPQPLRRLQDVLGLAAAHRHALCRRRRTLQRELHQSRSAYNGQRRGRRGYIHIRWVAQGILNLRF